MKWELREVSKSFSGTTALNNVSVTLNGGEIHALVGQNGAGKSTLVNILSGVYPPDHGSLVLDGSAVKWSGPSDARRRGVATIHQEFSLVRTLSVAENIALGDRAVKGRKIMSWSGMVRDSQRVLEQLGVHLDPMRVVGSLSVAEQQYVEIAKALTVEGNLLILDEPTAALSLEEAAKLRALVRRMARDGRAVLYISHRMEELSGFADTTTVLRDGRVVDRLGDGDFDLDRLVHAMLGSNREHVYVRPKRDLGATNVVVDDLSCVNDVQHISFSLRSGEVLGIAGVTGSGRTELLRAMCGVDRVTGGRITIGNRTIRLRSPKAAIRGGSTYLPENRKTDGLFFNLPVESNLSAASLAGITRGIFLDLRRERRNATALTVKMGMARGAPFQYPGNLSGGNQQKVVFGRLTLAGSQLLCLDEPTQGVDVGAKTEIYRLIDELSMSGASIVVVSSELTELLSVTDRIAIMRDKTITGIYDTGELDDYRLTALVSGGVA